MLIVFYVMAITADRKSYFKTLLIMHLYILAFFSVQLATVYLV